MARIDDDRQVRQLMEHRHGGKIERVSRIIVKRADAALAEDDLLVAARHDVLGAHQQLLERSGETALEQNGLAEPSELLEQVEVLHIARADLNDVHIREKVERGGAHDLGNDRKPGFLPGDLQKLETRGGKALKIVGRGARLEGAAAEDLRAGGLDRLRYPDDLLLALNAARARDHHEVSAADTHIPDLHDRIIRVKLAVAALERLRNALNGINDAKARDKVHIDPARVAHETEDGLILADGGVDPQSLLLQPVNKLVFLLFGSTVFQNYDHRFSLQIKQKSGTE